MLRKLKFSQNMLTKYDNFKHKFIKKWLLKNYCYIFQQTHAQYKTEVVKRAYVFWWQGENNAPEIVKVCIDSIRKNSGLDIVVISKDNYADWISLPDYIVHKMQEGKIGLAHFSDIIRFNLLFERGGLWLDATDLVTDAIPEYVFNYSFYSIKSAYAYSLGWKWTSFYMAAHKGDYLCGRMVEFYNHYWKDHDRAITYLFLDCWLSILYENDYIVKKEIDDYPYDNINIFAMTSIMNVEYCSDIFESARAKSYIHKTSYKNSYLEKIDDKLTIWGYLKQNENLNARELEG